METYRIKNLTFTYPNREKPALIDIDLTIKQGDFVVLCGPSGCGKTTLLRHIKPTTAPHGAKSGEIYFEGEPLNEISARDAAAKIGFVFQSPENQIVTDKVWHELAFGLESLGVDSNEIRLRVAEMASFFGISQWFHKPTTELSGGQKQILALASIMAMQPAVLILDEPTSQLDLIAAAEFLAIIGKINRELGITIILTEHRLEEVFPLAGRAIIMAGGRIIDDAPPNRLGGHGFLAMPTPMRVWAACGGAGDAPITIADGKKWLNTQKIVGEIELGSCDNFGNTAVTLKDVWFRYEKSAPDVVKGLNFAARYGEIAAILGGNGAGKTTALGLIGGLHSPYRGKIHASDQVYILPQNPQTLFVGKTLREDLQEISADFAAVAQLCGLDGLLDAHPYDLSGGEQQRAALAKVLLLNPKILLLDEPTKGLDAEHKQAFAAILRKLTKGGAAILMVSHDIEFCAEHADRLALFFDGGIVTENPPREFFAGNSFYTTAANRMARHILPNAITPSDIIAALGGKIPPAIPPHDPIKTPDPIPQNPSPQPAPKKLPTSTIAAVLMIFLTIPLTIFLGLTIFDDRQFYFIAMLIILQTMLPFALVFEGRKPQAREIVIIAVLCALAVAGRAAFFMLPQFKPVIAIIIIAGVAFGGEAGFFVGAMTGFVSNMFFGQGPWTPWQMFAFGIIGFLAGVLFRKGLLPRAKIPLCIFGGLATLLIFGGIMNPASVLIFQPNPTPEMFLLAYLYGIPLDLIHAAATIIFLAIIARPMLEKLDRIKEKYGLA